jgi:large repetitive protein
VTFSLGLQQCAATTDASGNASCQLTVTQTGNPTLTVTVPKDLTITGRTSTFGFTVNPQVTTLATSYQLGLTGTTLSATLNAEGNPLPNQPVTLSLGSETCGPLTTNGSGVVSCVVPPIVGSDTAALTASFAGVAGEYAPSSTTSTITVIFPTALSYTGATTAVFGSPVTLSGVLTQTNTSSPLGSRTVTFTLGSQQCSATTNAAGAASCTIPAVTGHASSVQVSYAGDAVTKPSSASASFTVTRAPTVTAAAAPTAGISTTSLSAALTANGSPIAGKQLILALGSNTCTATTDSTGTASCSVTTPNGGTATYTATFAGDGDYVGSADSKLVVLPTTALVYTGATTAAYNTSVTLAAQLTRPGDGAQLSGRTISFTLGTQQCSATTGATGVASCTIANVTADPGTITLIASYAGDATTRASNVTVPFVVTIAPTVTTAGTVTPGFASTTLNATLTSGGSPLSGKSIALTLGSNTCMGSTDATGTATCAVATPVASTATFAATFAGDVDYAASSDSKTVQLPVPTTLAYTGVTNAVFNGTATLSAVLTKTETGGAVSGKPITFALGSQQCSATTDATGAASCVIQPFTITPGSSTMTASFAGDPNTRPSTASASFAVGRAATAIAAAAPTAGSTTTTLNATLMSGATPLAGETLTLSLGGNACSAATDATGAASCSVTTPSGGTATYTATFNGDTDYDASSATRQVVLPTTTLVYTGATSAVYNGPATLSAQLTRTGDGSAVAGATVSFAIGTQTCQGTTGATGSASCTIAAITSPGGSNTVLVSFAGDATNRPSNTSSSFTVTQASTSTSAAAPVPGTATTTLSATLTSGGSPLSGEPMSLQLGSNACAAVTDSTGTATCAVTTPSGATATYTATFAGDGNYTGSTDSRQVVLPATTLLYSGATTAVHNGSATLVALLSKTGDGSPVSGRLISFTLAGSQTCQATTGPTGVATCTIASVSAHAGTTTVAAAYAGDATAAASSTSVPFTVSLATTTTVAATAVVGFNTTSLGATLASGTTPLAGKQLTLTLGSNSCTATTDASGTAACAVATPLASSATFTASFGGDVDYAASSGTKPVALPAPTKLVYTGATTAPFSGSAPLSALLTLADGVTPVSGKLVTLGFGTLHCSATTGANGSAACTIQPVTSAPGPYTVGAGFAGDATARPANATAPFTVTTAPTAATALAPTPGPSTTTLNATLTAFGSPLAGKTMTLTLGPNSCTGTTDSTGTAACAVTTPGTDTAQYTAAFAGDASYAASSDSRTVALFASTTLSYTGAGTATYGASAVLSATLTKTADSSPLAGRTVAFTLSTQSCQGTTNATGAATCTIAAVTAAAGPVAVGVSYAGDSTTRPSTTNATLTVTLASTVTVALAPTVGSPSTTLNATLTTGGSPLSGKAMTLTLGSSSCTGTTDATGTATCAVTTPSGDTATYTAAFNGDSGYAGSTDSRSVTLVAPTTLTYNGTVAAVYNTAATLAAKLTRTSDGAPLASRTVTFALGSQTCQGTTDATGAASCSIANVTADAGTYNVSASYAGDALTKPATDTKPFTVSKAATVTAAATPTPGVATTTLNATLTAGGSPLSGKAMTLTLGSSSCTGTTDATGTATCAVTTPSSDTATYTATFAADNDYLGSSDSKTVTLFAATTLTYNGSVTAAYNTATSLSATLKKTSDNTALAGRTVTFTLGTQTCQGTTSATGTASCSITIAQAAGTYTVGAAYAGDATTKSSTATSPFTISLAPTATVAATPVVGATTTPLSATLTSGSSPLAGKPMTLALGANSCTATTNASGVATCSVNTPSGTTAQFVASFATDGSYAGSSDTKTVTLIAPTTLTYNGATTAVYNSAAVLSATLTKTADASALSGRTVVFTLGAQTCQGTTSATGAATCTIANVTADAGSYSAVASYAGDALTASATATKPFTVTKAPTTTAAATPTVGTTTTPLSATLTSGGSPLAGKTLTLTLGANSCTDATDATGVATCSVNTPSGSTAQLTATFSGDADYAASSDTQTVTLLAPSTLNYLGSYTGEYHDLAIFSALLTGTNHQLLSGQQVTFTMGSQTCNTVTIFGVALCFLVIDQPAGTYQVTTSYGGNSTYAPTTISAPFTVSLEQTATTAGAVSTTGTTSTLTASLTSEYSPLAGKTITLTLGPNSCTDTTDANGNASCTVATPNANSATFTATFASDGYYAGSSDSETVTLPALTTLTYTGTTNGVHGGSATVAARLNRTGDGVLTGRTISFTLGTQQCSATTNLSGIATCTIQNLSAPVGAATVNAVFAGDSTARAATVSSPFTVTVAPTTLVADVAPAVLSGATVPLTGTLTSNGSPVPGRTLTLALGTSTCTATTSSTGVGACSVHVTSAVGPTTASASFAADGTYAAASDTDPTVVYGLAPGGTFVIGDWSDTGTVTYWGSQWNYYNSLSGIEPSSFRGFASSPSAAQCGGTWSTGTSTTNPTPPASGSLPAYMAVAVTSNTGRAYYGVYGNIVSVVVVKTSTYDGNPSHTATGTVVATIC